MQQYFLKDISQQSEQITICHIFWIINLPAKIDTFNHKCGDRFWHKAQELVI